MFFRSACRCHALSAMIIAVAALAGCHQDMYDQPRYEPLEPSDFFGDGRSARPLVPGTVIYGAEMADDVLHTGRSDGELATELPLELDAALLRRGQERFNIYCSNCHGRSGDGNGMIVQRGYRQPPTYHSDRLRGAPIGHFFEVMTNGFGVMPAYSIQVNAGDRWAIAAYIRALQLSQFATLDDVAASERAKLEQAAATPPEDANP
ncbi:MAG: quinol:cytochrome C oxidoreductase [Planctomycetota bacterium]|nr:MAG: quinol:cytochrome C oxidoreductase [Planctomycetota bacterium]